MFLASIVNENVQQHFFKTVCNSVPETTYGDLSPATVDGAVPIWGVEDKHRLRGFWSQITQGDYVVFYTGNNPIHRSDTGYLEYAAKVQETIKSIELSQRLWEPYRGSGGVGDDKRGPWPLILFLDEPTQIVLHHDELRELAGFSEDWNPQEFSSYSGTPKVRQKYGGLNALVDAKAV